MSNPQFDLQRLPADDPHAPGRFLWLQPDGPYDATAIALAPGRCACARTPRRPMRSVPRRRRCRILAAYEPFRSR